MKKTLGLTVLPFCILVVLGSPLPSDAEVADRVTSIGGSGIARATSDVRGVIDQECGQSTIGAMEDESIRVGGQFFTFTDESGEFELECPDSNGCLVCTDLTGRYCKVQRNDGPNSTVCGIGRTDTPLHILFDDTNSQAAERDAYYYVNVIHDWIKALEPAFGFVDTQVIANVNMPCTCSAYFSNGRLYFCGAGGGCNNAATIADIVYHEYGHLITYYIYYPNTPPMASGLAEAFAQLYAICLDPDPTIGDCFYTNGNGLYSAENVRQYPGTECAGEVHCLAEILVGSMWETYLNLREKYGDHALELFSRLFIDTVKDRQYSMPNFLVHLLMNNDTDGNLANGTPDWDEICDGFGSHGLPCPPLTDYVELTSDPIGNQPYGTEDHEILAIARSIGGGSLDPEGIQVYYTTEPAQGDPTWHTVRMQPTGNPDEYRGMIPTQCCGRMVSYYVRAAKLTGEFATAPAGAPYRQVYSFMVGPYETTIQDDLESDRGWTLGWAGDTATQGIWERTDPTGKSEPTYGPTQPEDDHTADGTKCFVTDGRGGYWPSYDVDGGVTSVVSPPMNWRLVRETVMVEFWSFFFDEAPNDDTLRCEVSSDDGFTWHQVFRQSGSNLNQWSLHRVGVTDRDVAFTDRMRVRFRMEDIGSPTTCAEAAIDDVSILLPVADASLPTAPLTFSVEQNHPNPFSPSTTIRYTLPNPSNVRIDVMDPAGRRVRILMNGHETAGVHAVTWDGLDRNQHRVEAGVYFYQVTTERNEEIRKMIILN
jgi:hypothetical protein